MLLMSIFPLLSQQFALAQTVTITSHHIRFGRYLSGTDVNHDSLAQIMICICFHSAFTSSPLTPRLQLELILLIDLLTSAVHSGPTYAIHTEYIHTMGPFVCTLEEASTHKSAKPTLVLFCVPCGLDL